MKGKKKKGNISYHMTTIIQIKVAKDLYNAELYYRYDIDLTLDLT